MAKQRGDNNRESVAAMEWIAFRVLLGSCPLSVTATTMGYRSYKNPLNKAPLRTVTPGRGNDPKFRVKASPGPK